MRIGARRPVLRLLRIEMPSGRLGVVGAAVANLMNVHPVLTGTHSGKLDHDVNTRVALRKDRAPGKAASASRFDGCACTPGAGTLGGKALFLDFFPGHRRAPFALQRLPRHDGLGWCGLALSRPARGQQNSRRCQGD